MNDKYNRLVTDHGNGSYSVEGITLNIEVGSIEDAVLVFNSMAPGDWVEVIDYPVVNDTDEIAKALSNLSPETLDALKLALGL